MQAVVEKVLRQNSLFLRPADSLTSANADSERAKDSISHFILRLAYCRTDELRQWMVRFETALFKYRWQMLYKQERFDFISRFNFQPISHHERDKLAPLLRAASLLPVDLKDFQFYKIPFELVPDLVAKRDVYLSEGFAYVPQTSLISVITAEFKHMLTAALEGTAKALPRMDDDDRLKPVLNNMSKNAVGQEYQTDSASLAGKISHADIDKLSAHFPPCMRHLHMELRRSSHLKHNGRMQFGLFLKGLGLTVEESLMFWRKSFNKMSDDQFQKGNYAYNVRHNYGQEGKRANYTPYSCVRIITSNPPSTGDSHGCPFKHFGKDSLHSMLLAHGMTESTSKPVLELAKAGHYQVACTKYFEITRGKFDPHKAEESQFSQQDVTRHNVMDTISHPNEFFELSVKAAGLSLGDKDDDKSKPKVEIPTIQPDKDQKNETFESEKAGAEQNQSMDEEAMDVMQVDHVPGQVGTSLADTPMVA